MSQWARNGLVLAIASLTPCLLLLAQERQPGKPYTPPNDLPLVEKVLASRRQYQQALEQLREHYEKVADLERKKWAEEELIGFHRINKHPFRMELDVPPPTLKPEFNIPEANELFRQAMGYKGKGSGAAYDDNIRRSELIFQRLLSYYPNSDKIDDAAYQLGDIYESRVFKQPRRAAVYFERCFQWNANTDTDARMRAARLYDKTLLERGKAIELYQNVAKSDADQKRVDEAKKRLAELSGQK
jgi:hypothetical protein